MAENEFGIDPELVGEFVDESEEILSEATNLFIALESDPGNRDAINRIFRIVHTIKGNAAFFNLLKVKSLAHVMEDLMNLVRDEKTSLSKESSDALIDGIDMLKEMMSRVRNGLSEIIDEDAYKGIAETIISFVEGSKKRDSLTLWKAVTRDLKDLQTNAPDGKVKQLVQRLNENLGLLSPVAPIEDMITDTLGQVKEIETSKELENRKSPRAEEQVTSTGKTMRVAEHSIDQFLDYVGELVVVGEMYHNLQERLYSNQSQGKAISDLKKTNDTFNTLSQNLQRSILEVRKVPVKALLQRAPRLVRDIAGKNGKKIRVETEGDELNIDKSLLETLDGPFTHMLRNSADHGVESPGERKKKGKPEEGLIKVSIVEEEETMSLSIQDDGAGLDREAILGKAVANGLITQEKMQSLDEQSIFQMIFSPGFSTAKTVTDVSGRGVGMDVVKRNVDAMNGKITIESEIGKGSIFTITFPKSVTVKIIQGFLVAVKNETYILPMNVVGESFEVSSKEITFMPGHRGECIVRYDKVYPIVRLSGLIDMPAMADEGTDRQEKIGVSVDTGTRTVVMLVDEVLGTQQVVVKDIDGLFGFSDIIAGGAILGDERIAIVLNSEKL